MAKKKSDKQLIVALDIGTNKIAALVGEVNELNQIEVVGFGTHPSSGLRKGVVVNIEATVQSIQKALEEAELMAGCTIHSVYTGIAGSHIRSLNSHGIVAIRDREVQQADVDRVIDAAKAVAIPADQKILHILPQEFVIDSQEGVREPVGMSGVRLEAKVHIVTGATSAAQNISKCIRRCGLQVGDIVLEQLASGYAVLNDDEKELGVCMVDIGGGTADIAVFTEGAIRYTSVIPIAGDHVTSDIAVALRTPMQHAEQIKIKQASLLEENLETTIQIASMAKRPPKQISSKELTDVVRARYEELFYLILNELRRTGLGELIAAGIVLTGGASKVHGCIELAEEVFKMPVRLGFPHKVSGLVDVRENPIFATGVGLLLHGLRQQNSSMSYDVTRGEHNSIWARMKNWIHGHF